MKILITGVAGFIGSSLALLLENKDHQVFGVDNLNTYYDPKLKIRRLQRLEKTIFIEEDISDLKAMNKIFKENRPDIVVNLAAHAGHCLLRLIELLSSDGLESFTCVSS